MTTALITDGASILRAIGLLRAVIAKDDNLVNAIMEAALEDPDEQVLMRTFGALVATARAAIAGLACANVYGDDVNQVLTTLQRHLIVGDVPPPDARPEATS